MYVYGITNLINTSEIQRIVDLVLLGRLNYLDEGVLVLDSFHSLFAFYFSKK